LASVTTVENFAEFVNTHGSVIADMGLPRIYTSTIGDKNKLVTSVLRYLVVFRLVKYIFVLAVNCFAAHSKMKHQKCKVYTAGTLD